MCGRYVISFSIEMIEQIIENIKTTPEVKEEYKPSYNVCPGDRSLVISSEKPNQLELYRFGLTPKWAKTPVINAKSEGIMHKKTFMRPIRKNWCLVLANAFIEGTEKEGLNKPFKVWLRNQELFCMGGIWDEYTNKKTGEQEKQFAIITLPPNELMKEIGHHRMPLVFPQHMQDRWLYRRNLADVTGMFKQFPAKNMNAIQISTKIKYPRIKDKSAIEPVGKAIYKQYDYKLKKGIKLVGMGSKKKEREDRDTPGWNSWHNKD